MTLKKFFKTRTLHYYLSIAMTPVFILVILTGILLLMKKDLDWVQPPTVKGVSKVPALTFEQILEKVRTVPECEASDWKGIERVDIRPSKGMMKVQCTNNSYEVQIDSETGEVLQVAKRYSDLIESLHDGSFFHDYVKKWLFLPMSIVMLVVTITGVMLFWTIWTAKLKRNKKKKLKESLNQ